MKYAYIEFKSDFPFNTDGMCAADGFFARGYEVKPFTKTDIMSGKITDYMLKTHVFVGCIDTMKLIFRQLKCTPEIITFPEPFYNANLLQRYVWTTSIGNVIEMINSNTSRTLYVKPATEVKSFDCMKINKNTLHSLMHLEPNTDVIVSNPFNHKIVAEYRCYINNSVIEDIRLYTGDPLQYINNISKIVFAISNYKNAPTAYTIDIAILENGSIAVIELNDFWSIGSYGLEPELYSIMLENRYKEITNKIILTDNQ